jgi:hypothetical protein
VYNPALALCSQAYGSAKEVTTVDETLHILQMLEQGTISADEAHQLLLAAQPDQEKQPEDVQPAAVGPTAGFRAPEFRRYRLLSYIPFGVSLAILLLCGWATYVLYRHAEGRATASLVILLIVTALVFLVTAVALWMTATPWLHVRIRDRAEHRIAISLPLPLTIAYWGLHLAQRFVHDESTAQLDAAAQMIQALRSSRSNLTREPIAIDVDDEGGHVQVYIG